MDNVVVTNQLIENKKISEIICEKDFMYVLAEEVIFSATEYKVMNSISTTNLLKCKKMKYNGKSALYYCTEDYKALNIILPSINSQRFLSILKNVIYSLYNIINNGFLVDCGLDLRINRIFVNQSTNQVYLTYLPINDRCFDDSLFLEKQLRKDFKTLISELSNLQSTVTLHIASLLEDETYLLSDIITGI